MKKDKEKEVDWGKIEEVVFSLEPTNEDKINRRIHHQNFARIVLWLCYHSSKSDIIIVKDLARFMKYTHSTAYSKLMDFVEMGLLKKTVIGNLSQFYFVKNGNKPLILNYMEKVKKVLGLDV